jgi:hypothetical protein
MGQAELNSFSGDKKVGLKNASPAQILENIEHKITQ